ncbi:hypothetical protein [Streptomyces marianii]|uniref:Uncharacterized protein n=1 Tax=Streptomyces marianii TaxID=1817406 RepID=A0A5R9DR49_9ACTN|nr:hypothetical protein [Streptomyces marianii]TLQ38840.1 hypothetical protein FEF34_40210 [Streptomyces marianii]
MDSQPEPAPKARGRAAPQDRPEPPLVVIEDLAPAVSDQARELAERVIAVGRTSGISPEAQRALFLSQRELFPGGMGSGKTSALAVTRAQLDAAGTPYEESDDGRGTTTIRIRPAGAESTEE